MELKKEMFSIVYLFMNCDGNISDEEKNKFSLLVGSYYKKDFALLQNGKDENLSNFEGGTLLENEVVSECESVFNSAFDKDDLPNVIEQKIKEIIGCTYFSYKDKILLLWLLVDFAYADGTCAESEKKLLRSIFHMLELTDKSILYDLEDTAKAALAIESRRKKIMEELDEEQKVLVSSVNELIEEEED